MGGAPRISSGCVCLAVSFDGGPRMSDRPCVSPVASPTYGPKVLQLDATGVSCPALRAKLLAGAT